MSGGLGGLETDRASSLYYLLSISYAITYKEGVWHNMDSTEICRPVLSVWGGWVFKQISANMGYHVRHHVANPLIPTPPSRYNKMI